MACAFSVLLYVAPTTDLLTSPLPRVTRYRNPPCDGVEPEIVSTYTPGSFTIGAKSRVGRGGMQAKIEAATTALDRGVRCVVIASGYARAAVALKGAHGGNPGR